MSVELKEELKRKAEEMDRNIDFLSNLLDFHHFSKSEIDDLRAILFRWFVLLRSKEGVEKMYYTYVAITKSYIEQLFNLLTKTRSLLKLKGGEMK